MAELVYERFGLDRILDTLQLTEFYPKKLTQEIVADKTFSLGDLHPKREVRNILLTIGDLNLLFVKVH